MVSRLRWKRVSKWRGVATEPKIPTAPTPTPIGFGWELMARNAERAGWTDRVDEFREMARKSREVGRDLMAGEDVKPKPKGQLTLW